MKSFLFAVLFGALLVVAGWLGWQYYYNPSNQGTLSLSTSANAEVTPDTVEINIAVKTNDKKSLSTAAKENKEKSDKIYNMLTSMINADKGDYIKTANYNAQPVYVYDNDLKRRVMDKYEVSNQIIVHTKNIDKLGEIIDQSIALGATDINDLNFSVSDYEAKCRELLKTAGVQAYARGEVAASAANAKITGVRSINANCSENQFNHVPYRMMAKNMVMAEGAVDMVAAAPSTPISSGSIKVFANYNVEYEIK